MLPKVLLLAATFERCVENGLLQLAPQMARVDIARWERYSLLTGEVIDHAFEGNHLLHVFLVSMIRGFNCPQLIVDS